MGVCTLRTKEDPSPDWISIGEAVQRTSRSLREIGREFGVSDTAIRKKAKVLGWGRPEAVLSIEPRREPIQAKPRTNADTSVSELTKRGRGSILDLLTELEFLNKNALVLSEIVESWFDGATDRAARTRLLKALDHETRAKSCNALATALAKLNDAAPGKKDQATADADVAGHGSEWESDLDFGRPN